MLARHWGSGAVWQRTEMVLGPLVLEQCMEGVGTGTDERRPWRIRLCSSARRRQRGAGGVTRACLQRPGWLDRRRWRGSLARALRWPASVPASTCTAKADWVSKERWGRRSAGLGCAQRGRGRYSAGAARRRPVRRLLFLLSARRGFGGRRKKLPPATGQIGQLQPAKWSAGTRG